MNQFPHLSTREGTLFIDDVDTTTLAKQYGTPLYIYSKHRILGNVERLKSAFTQAGVDINIHYAVKANNNLAILHLLREAGCGADVSCGPEIELARHAGFAPEKMIYSGNNNPDDDLIQSLKFVDKINLDDISLLPRLLAFGKPKILSFRINPGMGDGLYKSITLGGKDSKFGMDPDIALQAYQQAKAAGIKRFGIHMMPGSGGLNEDFFPEVVEKLIATAEKIAQEVGITFEFLDIGGGFGIPYKPEENPLDIQKVAQNIAAHYHAALQRGIIGKPTLDCEPGRYLVGDAGVLLSRVHNIKEAEKTFAGTDAGMQTLIRPAFYGAFHEIVVANKMDDIRNKTYTVCGPICENTDQDPHPRTFPTLQNGDLLATLNAGAYGYVMALTFNTQPRPAELLVDGARHDLIHKRETLQDLIHGMIVPIKN